MATAAAAALTRRRSRTSARPQILGVLAAFMLRSPTDAASPALTANAHIGTKAAAEPEGSHISLKDPNGVR